MSNGSAKRTVGTLKPAMKNTVLDKKKTLVGPGSSAIFYGTGDADFQKGVLRLSCCILYHRNEL